MVQELNNKNRQLESDVERLREAQRSLQQQLTAAQETLKSKMSRVDTLQKEVEDLNSKSEEKVMYLQMQLKNAKTADEDRDREVAALNTQLETVGAQVASMRHAASEKDSAVSGNREVIEALQNKLFELEPEIERSKEKARELERNVNAQMLLKAEQEALLTALRRDLRATIEAHDEATKRVKAMEEQKLRSDSQLVKMADLNDQLAVLQSAVEDKSSLITRLQAEAQAGERNRAMRTALLASTEAQLEALNRDLVVKEEAARDAAGRADSFLAQVAALEGRLDEQAATTAARIVALEGAVATERARAAEALAEARRAHEQAVDGAMRDYAKKSALARALLSERVEEVRALSIKNEELQTEINSGAPNERRIFELAKLQANREATHGQRRWVRSALPALPALCFLRTPLHPSPFVPPCQP